MTDFSSLPDPEAAALISAEVADWDRSEPLHYAALGLMAVTAMEVWQMESEVEARVRAACDEVV